MAVHAQENVFQPSASWMSRAGVMVEYSPEDTFKSLIERGFIDKDLIEEDNDESPDDYENILSSTSLPEESFRNEMDEGQDDGDIPHDERRVAGCEKPFEAMIEEQMRLEEENLKVAPTPDQVKKRKTFLRRGEGLARFSQPSIRKTVSKQRESLQPNATIHPKDDLKEPPKPLTRRTEVIKQLKRHVSGTQQDSNSRKRPPVEVPYASLSQNEKSSLKISPRPEPLHPLKEKDQIPSKKENQETSQSSGKSNNEDELEVFELFERYADSSFESSISSIARLDKEKLIKKINLKQSRSRDVIEVKTPEKQKPTENDVAAPMSTESSSFAQPTQSTSYPQQNSRFPHRAVLKASEVESSQRTFRDEQTWAESLDEHGTSTSENCSQNQSQEFEEAKTSEKAIQKTKENVESPADLQNVISNISEAVFPRFSSKVNAQISENSKLLVEKLAELEKDYAVFAREKNNLARQKREFDEERRQFKTQVAEFEKQKTSKIAEINAFKEKETKRLRKERKTLEEYERVMKNGLNRENRQELETLKNRLTDLYEEMSRRENKFQSAQGRMRDRIAALENERDELREQVHNLEAIRVDLQSKVISSQPTAFSVAKKVKQPFLSLRNSAQPTPTEAEENAFQQSKRLQRRDNIEPAQRAWDAYQQAGASVTSSGAWQPRQRQSAPTATQYMTPFPTSEVSSTLTSSSHNSGGKSQAVIARLTSNEGSVTGSGSGRDPSAADEKTYPDGKVEKINSDGSRVVLFPNGTVKEVSADKLEVVKFFNGDVKRMSADKRVIYYYAETQTTHTTFPDGMETMQFPNGQKEVIYPDQTREIVFPDGVRKYIYPNKTELSMFPSGMIVKVLENGDKEINFTNGQREILTNAFKRREYPDGTTKTLYPDGRQETRYSSGRIRVKDKNGQVIENRKCSPVRTSAKSDH